MSDDGVAESWVEIGREDPGQQLCLGDSGQQERGGGGGGGVEVRGVGGYIGGT